MCHVIKITQGTINVCHFMATNYIRTLLEDRLEPYTIVVALMQKAFMRQQPMSVSHNISFDNIKARHT